MSHPNFVRFAGQVYRRVTAGPMSEHPPRGDNYAFFTKKFDWISKMLPAAQRLFTLNYDAYAAIEASGEYPEDTQDKTNPHNQVNSALVALMTAASYLSEFYDKMHDASAQDTQGLAGKYAPQGHDGSYGKKELDFSLLANDIIGMSSREATPENFAFWVKTISEELPVAQSTLVSAKELLDSYR